MLWIKDVFWKIKELYSVFKDKKEGNGEDTPAATNMDINLCIDRVYKLQSVVWL